MAVKLDRYAAVALRPVKGPVEQRRSLLFERALGIVLEWVALHRDELLENWALAREKQPVFEPLKSVEEFKRFQIHPEFHTLVWPNGADFAPEFLHREARVTA